MSKIKFHHRAGRDNGIRTRIFALRGQPPKPISMISPCERYPGTAPRSPGWKPGIITFIRISHIIGELWSISIPQQGICTDKQDRTVMKPINLSTPYESEGICRYGHQHNATASSIILSSCRNGTGVIKMKSPTFTESDLTSRPALCPILKN